MTDLPQPDPIAAAARRRTARRSLSADASCQLCGDTRPEVLEDHHVLGVAASNTVRVWLCRNCHRTQTTAQHDLQALPPSGRYRPPPDTVIERVARGLRSLAVFIHALAHWLTTAADQLLAVVTGLDTTHPTWRTEAWAR